MELRHLRYFIAVAEELHFQRAAKRLHIEQSPLSRAIKDLENHLGVRLLERTTRCTTITKAGQVFLAESRRILASVEQAKSAIKSASLGYSQQLRIAITDGVPQYRVSTLISKLRQHNHELDVRLYEMTPSKLQEAIQSHEIDLGLALSAPENHDIESTPLWHDGLCALLPNDHSLARSHDFTIAELSSYPLILPAAKGVNSVHTQIHRLVRQTSKHVNVVQLTDSINLMITLVASGIGIGFASMAQLSGHGPVDVVIKPLTGHSPVITTYMLHRTHDIPLAVLPFMKLLEDDIPTLPKLA